jgi:hypothetical protein
LKDFLPLEELVEIEIAGIVVSAVGIAVEL